MTTAASDPSLRSLLFLVALLIQSQGPCCLVSASTLARCQSSVVWCIFSHPRRRISISTNRAAPRILFPQKHHLIQITRRRKRRKRRILNEKGRRKKRRRRRTDIVQTTQVWAALKPAAAAASANRTTGLGQGWLSCDTEPADKNLSSRQLDPVVGASNSWRGASPCCACD